MSFYECDYVFFFNDTATTEIYTDCHTRSLHDALPISILMAFSEELFWAGVQTVAKGQWEAARATGLSFGQTLFYIILPQALRITVPPLTSRVIATIKNTALASTVAVPELLGRASIAVSEKIGRAHV